MVGWRKAKPMTDLDDNPADDSLASQRPSDGLLQVSYEAVDGAAVIHAAGEVDMATRERLDLQLQGAESQETTPALVVLDLTGVRFLASTGLSLLVDHHETCAEVGSRLIVVATGRTVLRPIQLTGLDSFLTIVPTVQVALASASSLPLDPRRSAGCWPGTARRELRRRYLVTCPECGRRQHIQGRFESCMDECGHGIESALIPVDDPDQARLFEVLPTHDLAGQPLSRVVVFAEET